MPHLHLPAEHSDADVVLAANVAAGVNSAELYVAWTHETGPGAVPEVEAEVHDRGAAAEPASPLVELFAVLAASFVAIWNAFAGTPARETDGTARQAPARRTAGETA
jgi:hypothetical protein